MLKNKKGFTLVEVAVVLVILAVLAAVAVPNVSGWLKDANERALISETKIAVKTAEGIIAQSYARGGTPSYDLTNVIINQESGLDGKAYGYEISDNGNGNELLHLSYTGDQTYDDSQTTGFNVLSTAYADGYSDTKSQSHVTYCSHPGDCTEHDKAYTFIKGDYYKYTDTETEDEKDEDGDDNTTDNAVDNGQQEENTGSAPETVTTPYGTSGGFFLQGDDEVVYVKAIDTYEKLQNLPSTQNGFNLSACVISIENDGIFEYYYVRLNRNPWFQKSWSKTQLRDFVLSNTPQSVCPGKENNTICCGTHILYLGNSTEQIKAVARYDWMHTGTLTYKAGVANTDPNKYQIFTSNNPHDYYHTNWDLDSQFETLSWEYVVQ